MVNEKKMYKIYIGNKGKGEWNKVESRIKSEEKSVYKVICKHFTIRDVNIKGTKIG